MAQNSWHVEVAGVSMFPACPWKYSVENVSIMEMLVIMACKWWCDGKKVLRELPDQSTQPQWVIRPPRVMWLLLKCLRLYLVLN